MTNSSVHRIKLAGPWSVKKGDSEQILRVKMPADWRTIFDDYVGTAVFSRLFHSPTGLENHCLFLLVPPTFGSGKISLNGHLLGTFDETESKKETKIKRESRYEITLLIQQNNRIEIELTCNPNTHPNCGLPTAVVLEIVEPSISENLG